VLLAVGPVVSIVLIVGLIVLLRSDRRGTDGWLAAGFLIFIAFLLITAARPTTRLDSFRRCWPPVPARMRRAITAFAVLNSTE
jgi:hypothetical protein